VFRSLSLIVSSKTGGNVLCSGVDDKIDLAADSARLVITVKPQICGCTGELSERCLQIAVWTIGDEKLELGGTV
jgi:hypothetical protein